MLLALAGWLGIHSPQDLRLPAAQHHLPVQNHVQLLRVAAADVRPAPRRVVRSAVAHGEGAVVGEQARVDGAAHSRKKRRKAQKVRVRRENLKKR